MISFIVLISPGNKTAVKDDFSLHQGAGCQGRNSPSTGLGGGKKENRAGEGKRRESFPSIGWSHLKEVKLECKSWCLRALAGERNGVTLVAIGWVEDGWVAGRAFLVAPQTEDGGNWRPRLISREQGAEGAHRGLPGELAR